MQERDFIARTRSYGPHPLTGDPQQRPDALSMPRKKPDPAFILVAPNATKQVMHPPIECAAHHELLIAKVQRARSLVHALKRREASADRPAKNRFRVLGR